MSNRKYAKAVLECGQSTQERVEHIVKLLNELGAKMLDVREGNGQAYDQVILLIGLSKEFEKMAPDLMGEYSIRLNGVTQSQMTLKYQVSIRLEKKKDSYEHLFVGHSSRHMTFSSYESPERQSFLQGIQTTDEIQTQIGMRVRERYGAGVLQADSVIAVPRASSTDSGLIRGVGVGHMMIDEMQLLSESDMESIHRSVESLRSRTPEF